MQPDQQMASAEGNEKIRKTVYNLRQAKMKVWRGHG